MKEHGILFSPAMVRAILAGQKTQTRRLAKPQPIFQPSTVSHAPHGPVGRRLWVRETWHQCPHCERTVSYRAGGWREAPSGAPDDGGDRCDDDTRPLSPKCEAHGWKPSIHMPRWASRITLEVTRVRVERVGDISEEDAKAEGVNPRDAFIVFEGVDEERVRRRPDMERTHRGAFACLWDEINGAGSFASSPWVWVYDFRRVG